MQRVWMVCLSLLVLAVAGCASQPPASTGTGGGATSGTNASVNGSVGNASANATIGTYGNATVNNTQPNGTGNETTANGTGNVSAGPQVLVTNTYAFSPTAPPDATFEVPAAFRSLTVDANVTGFIAGLKVTLLDPGGNRTVVVDDALTGGTSAHTATVDRPVLGTWTLHFEGSGSGHADVVVRGA